LEAPKPCQTKFEVLSRETLLDTTLPVTRLLLTSITGRTHQLNVHCAAFGHPIVGDRIYGWDGDAAPYGGLDPPVDGTATVELQKQIASKATGTNMCAHAKILKFRHPILDTILSFESEASF
jgi:23S rRNA-/tRNA-specific pseudouridylate synthase